MAAFGAKVVVSSRKAGACEEVGAAIVAKRRRRPSSSRATSAARKSCSAWSTRRSKAYGPVDILVCNAAVNPHFGPSQEIPDGAFDKIMANNIRSNHWLCQMTIPSMAERGGGVGHHRLVDRRPEAAPTQLGAYGISKAADMQMARNLAVEWGPRNVRVNCIAPGLVRTDFARALWENPEIYAATVQNYPLRRIGEPDEIAGAAVFLASAAGSFTTGQTIVVDGGATITGG